MLIAVDCEGPLTKNDNAFELSSHFIPNGEALFTRLSQYDDILAFILKRPNYQAGSTLRFICPFFKAFGVTNQHIKEFSEAHILIVNGADTFLKWTIKNTNSIIISTSYGQYIHAFCSLIGFPVENTFSTFLDLDSLTLPSDELKYVRDLADKITSLPVLEWDADLRSFHALPSLVKASFNKIDKIITKVLPEMRVGQYLKMINPVGSVEKAVAVKKGCKSFNDSISDVIYIGDSITDVEAFKLVRDGGGLTIAFNGNRYANSAAEIACLSYHSDILTVLCEIFIKYGKTKVLEIINNWPSEMQFINEIISPFKINTDLLDKEKEHPSILKVTTDENRNEIIARGEKFRKQVRGQEVGRLG